jgi:hypothetical protein
MCINDIWMNFDSSNNSHKEFLDDYFVGKLSDLSSKNRLKTQIT